MLRQEAEALMQRLVNTYEKDLKPETWVEYVKQFIPLHHGRAQIAIERVIQDSRFWPRIADVLTKYRQVCQEVKRDNSGVNLFDTPYGKWLMYRQHRISYLTREQYWRFVYDEDFRANQDEVWERDWKVHLSKYDQATKGEAEDDAS
jgi:carbonic anhydrase